MGTKEDEEEEEGEEEVRYFTVDGDSGVIRTTRPLDREAQPWHNITVMASEVGEYPPASLLRSHGPDTQTHPLNMLAEWSMCGPGLLGLFVFKCVCVCVCLFV